MDDNEDRNDVDRLRETGVMYYDYDCNTMNLLLYFLV